MNNFIKKQIFFFSLIAAPYMLYATTSAYQPDTQIEKDYTLELSKAKRKLLVDGYCRGYGVYKNTILTIVFFVHDNLIRYRNKPLPLDLSGKDLSDLDFTGCKFDYTNLTDTKLTNIILTNTSCDYQKAFLDNMSQIECGKWYRDNLIKDLKSIAQVYPKLDKDSDKARLLRVACGLSRCPLYIDIDQIKDFSIKLYYWSSTLLRLKKTLHKPYGEELFCSLKKVIEHDNDAVCWKTNYPQHKISIYVKASHANFATYLNDFNNGLSKYQCQSKSRCYFTWYKEQIIKNIEGVAAAYPDIQEARLQQEACNIAHALSKSYQIEKEVLGYHYIFYQNRLIKLKKSVGAEIQDKIYYNCNYVL